MGGATSKDVVLKADEAASNSAQAAAEAAAAQSLAASLERQADDQRAAATTAYLDAEEALYHEGYKKGVQDALSKLDTELEKQAHTAYAHASWEDEKAKAVAIQAELEQLTAKQYRAPLRPTECGEEERAVLACEPRADARRCADVIKAYDQCAQRVTSRLMNPLR